VAKMDVYEVMYVKGVGGGEVNRLNTLESITRRRGRGGRKERKAVEEDTKGEEGFFFFLPWFFLKKI
jgi:hypothetical protein